MTESRMELLVRLLTKHQDELFRYIFSLVPHEEDARDVLQETSVALCRKFVDYDPAKPFLPWAFGFAQRECLKQRERNVRGTRLFKLDVIERLVREREGLEPMLEARLQALELCLGHLPPDDRDLIRLRYQGRVGTEELVRQSGASRRTVFRRLDAIRRALLDCIGRRVGEVGPV